MIQVDDLAETSELAAFTRTVEAGSLSRAAKELRVPRATVGRRLARLEERLGARLVRRTTRKLMLTEEGRAFYDRAKLALDAVRDATRTVKQSAGAVRGHLRVSTPPMQGIAFGALVSSFLDRYPDVTMDVDSSAKTVSFGDEGFDLAIRASVAIDPGLVRRPLAVSRLLAVASPVYVARRGLPKRAADLARHVCLVGYARGQAPTREWPLVRGGTVRVRGRLSCNELFVLLQAARSGLGIALLPEDLVQSAITNGELVHVLPGKVGGTSHVAVVFPERRLLRPVVRAFVEEIAAWAKREPGFGLNAPGSAPAR